MSLVFTLLSYKTEKNYWMGVAAYFMQVRFIFNFMVPFKYDQDM